MKVKENQSSVEVMQGDKENGIGCRKPEFHPFS